MTSKNKYACKECGKMPEYPKKSTYADLWITWLGDDTVTIHCSHGCLGHIMEEEVRPDRFLLEFGKYEGMRVSEVKDIEYLNCLLKDRPNSLLAACIRKCQ